MKKWYGKLRGIVNLTNVFALVMVIYTANAACLWVHHQPTLPEEAKKFRKF